jgi:hypothetical protein
VTQITTFQPDCVMATLLQVCPVAQAMISVYGNEVNPESTSTRDFNRGHCWIVRHPKHFCHDQQENQTCSCSCHTNVIILQHLLTIVFPLPLLPPRSEYCSVLPHVCVYLDITDEECQYEVVLGNNPIKSNTTRKLLRFHRPGAPSVLVCRGSEAGRHLVPRLLRQETKQKNCTKSPQWLKM